MKKLLTILGFISLIFFTSCNQEWNEVIEDTANVSKKIVVDSKYNTVWQEKKSGVIKEDVLTLEVIENSKPWILYWTFIYEKSPSQWKKAEIYFRTSTEKVFWKIIKQPKESKLELNVSSDSKYITFVADIAWTYIIEVSDQNWNVTDTTFSISNFFPYDISKVKRIDEDEPLEESIWEIVNQYWVTPFSFESKDLDMKSTISKFPDLKYIGEDRNYWTLIEIDEKNPEALQQIEKLRLEPMIKKVENRIFIGKYAIRSNLGF